MKPETALQTEGEVLETGEMKAFWLALGRHWRLFVVGALVGAAAGLGMTYLMTPVYTATTTLMPPQQAQSSAAAALASLGSLAGLATGGPSRTPADQYVALLQSISVSDRIVERFNLMAVYDSTYKIDARRRLLDSVRMTIGKKDGLLTIEVEDTSPQRASEIANRYVDELRRMVAQFAVTEAQQRRLFFEAQMKAARDRLSQAQLALQASGFDQGALKAEPRAAADNYARLRAELTAGEVRLQSLRTALLDTAPEIRAQAAAMATLRTQVSRLERSDGGAGQSDFVTHYRDFKYQEALFDVFARQYELARVDESRDGGLIQVLDSAAVPEKRTRPKRTQTALISAATTTMALLAWIIIRVTVWTGAPARGRPTLPFDAP
jgi:uncharacterized protein involved in exopolysaccharide biosynthesis